MILDNSSLLWFFLLALFLLSVIFILAIKKASSKSNIKDKRKAGTARVVAILSMIILLMGILGVYFIQKQKKKDLMQLLSNNARSVAEGIAYYNISGLKFTVEDLDNPHYQICCRQLSKASSELDYLNIYTMILRDSVIVFGPESIEASSIYSSKPGDIYIIPPKGLFDVFISGIPHTTNPYEDEYGRFISSFYPVFRVGEINPFLVVGIDMEQDQWKQILVRSSTISLKITSLLLFFLLFFLVLYRPPSQSKRKINIWWLSPEALITFIGAILIWALIIFVSVSAETRYQSAIFNQSASLYVDQLRSYFSHVERRLWRISNELTRRPNINQEEFNNISVSFLESDYTLLTGWAVEKEASNENEKEYIIQHTAPSAMSPLIPGKAFPLLSDSTFHLIESSLMANVALVEDPLYLSADFKNAKAIYIPFDLSKNPERAGFFFMLIDPYLLLERALIIRGRQEDKLIYFTLENIDDAGGTSLWASNREAYPENPSYENFSEAHYMFLFGNTFKCSLYPVDLFYQTHSKFTFVILLPVAIIYIILLTLFVGFLSTRRSRLEKEVEKRTKDLNQSELRFQSLYNNMTGAVVFYKSLKDAKGKINDFLILDCNQSYLDLFKLKRNEVIGFRSSVVNPLSNKQFPEEIVTLFDKQENVRVECYAAPNGRYFQISFIPISGDTFAVILNDITQRILSDNVIKESEEKYRMISENVADIIWVMNAKDFSYTYISPSVHHIGGYTVEEALKLTLKQSLTADSYKYIKKVLPERIVRFEKGETSLQNRTLNLNQIKKDGSIIQVEVTTTLIVDNNGKVKELLGVTRDVTGMVKAREALRKSEESHRLLIENQSDLIIKCDLKGKFLYVSPSYCQTFGKSEKELLGTIHQPRIDERDIVVSRHALEKLRKPPYKIRFEHRVLTTGGWRWISWNNSAIFENGEPIAYVGVGRDVTYQKEYEEKLKISYNKLQSQNREYMALNEEYQTINDELHNANNQLASAIERAKESENLKTAFLQNMSHEIRTPLNAIIGFSEMLTLPDFEENERAHFAETIVNSSRELLRLVNDILTISTIEARQEKLEQKKIIIKNLFEELETVFFNDAQSKGVRLKSVFPEDVSSNFFIEADDMKLKQVFNNLISNALKFTDKGEISFGFDLVEDKKIRFFVKDSGIGIEKQQIDLIFNRFSQAGPEIQKKYGGTGLGLAICKGHVELMGGSIWVESSFGKGSTFYFVLPLKNNS